MPRATIPEARSETHMDGCCFGKSSLERPRSSEKGDESDDSDERWPVPFADEEGAAWRSLPWVEAAGAVGPAASAAAFAFRLTTFRAMEQAGVKGVERSFKIAIARVTCRRAVCQGESGLQSLDQK